MRHFTVLLRPSSGPIDDATRRRYEHAVRREGLPTPPWSMIAGIAVMTGSDGFGAGPTVSRVGTYIGVGTVRLDNRDLAASWGPLGSPAATDLDLVVAAIARQGPSCIVDLLGDFAFVAWDTATHEAVAARDAFGIRTLYVRESPDLLAFASHAAHLTESDTYDLDYIATFLVNGFPSPERTIFADVRAVPPGTIWRYRNGVARNHRYWSATNFPPAATHVNADAPDVFRGLFADAVRLRLSNHDDTWAQLSGGLDSSSVVSMAQSLATSGRAHAGIAGTVTIVESYGGDERAFSDIVVSAFGLRNEQIVNYWMWQDNGNAPPRTDRPQPVYPFFLRDQQMCAAVRRGGGRVLLSGFGSDQYLTGSLTFFADRLAKGPRLATLLQIARWAAVERRSAWSFGFKRGVLPLLPLPLQRRFAEGTHVPTWIDRTFARRFAIRDRFQVLALMSAPSGAKYNGYIAGILDNTAAAIDHGVIDDAIEVRYPFLYRPLVEYCLRLPPEFLAGPRLTKRILREAMRGILPEPIRQRTTKGAVDGRIQWSLSHEHERLDALLTRPVLADLGCIDARELRFAVAAARRGEPWRYVEVLYPLALETWLSVRSGRWTTGGTVSQSPHARLTNRTA